MIKNFVDHFENLVKGQPAGYIGMFFRASKKFESLSAFRRTWCAR